MQVRYTLVMRRWLCLALALVVFGLLAWPSWWLWLWCTRELYRLFELVGIMNPGQLGGQILGYNFLRDPQWTQLVVRSAAAAIAFAPALAISFWLRTRLDRAPGATRCGACDAVLKNLSTCACPNCNRPL